MASWPRIAAAALGLAAALSQPCPGFAQEVTLDIHHLLSSRAPAQVAFLEPWARRIETQSDGRIAIDIYPDMELGGQPQQLYDQVVQGRVDIAWTVSGYTPGKFPRTEVFELPFIHEKNAVATNLAIQDVFDPYLAEDYTEVHPLLVHVHAGQAFDSAGQPVRSLDDLKGLRFRTPTRTGGWMLEAFGAKSVGMPVPALPLALDKDIVDGAVIPYEIFPPLRLQEHVSAVTVGHDDRRFGTAVFIFIMNKQVYEGLPPDLRQVIDANSGRNLAADIGQVWMDVETKASQFIETSGVEMIELSAEETDRLQRASEPVIDRWIDDVASRGIDGRQLVQAAKEAISRHQ
ncbi:MAG: TRAP transporter substrate-binding protein [Alphaproteobacteria bacterium]